MFIHVNGVRLFYEKQGTGKPLILLHGNEEDHRIFDEAIELLKKHYTVYIIWQKSSPSSFIFLSIAPKTRPFRASGTGGALQGGPPLWKAPSPAP